MIEKPFHFPYASPVMSEQQNKTTGTPSARTQSILANQKAIEATVSLVAGGVINRLENPLPFKDALGRWRSPRMVIPTGKEREDIKGEIALILVQHGAFHGERTTIRTRAGKDVEVYPVPETAWSEFFSAAFRVCRVFRWDHKLPSYEGIEDTVNDEGELSDLVMSATNAWQWHCHCGWHSVPTGADDWTIKNGDRRKALARRLKYLSDCAKEAYKADKSRKRNFRYQNALRMIRASVDVLRGNGWSEFAKERDLSRPGTARKAKRDFLAYIALGEKLLNEA